MGNIIGKVISLVTFVAALGICVVLLDRARDQSWTTASLFSIFLGMALRAFWSLFDLHKRHIRLAVSFAYLTATVFAASGVASLGAVLAESFVPAIFLAPAALVMATFMVVLARALPVG